MRVQLPRTLVTCAAAEHVEIVTQAIINDLVQMLGASCKCVCTAVHSTCCKTDAFMETAECASLVLVVCQTRCEFNMISVSNISVLVTYHQQVSHGVCSAGHGVINMRSRFCWTMSATCALCWTICRRGPMWMRRA